MPNVIRLLLGNIQVVFYGAIVLYPLLRRLGIPQRLKRWFWS
ncbi:MAG TPA: hypothetical protein VMM78_04855 [Thermomicrobiales bacterium]|nr:hypothetical protein [Thermomicrobiales bacterium]